MSVESEARGKFAQIYVASAITNVAEGLERRQTVGECEAIVAAVTDYSIGRGLPVEAYDPIRNTPPWQQGPKVQPPEIWAIDTRKVLAEADAIIVNGGPGGSTGVGIELALAFGRGLPTLYLYTAERPVTKMVLGMPGFVTVREFHRIPDQFDALKTIVTDWLDTWEPLIAVGPQRRRRDGALFAAVHAELVHRWEKLDFDTRVVVCDAVQLHSNAIVHFLTEPLWLASMPAVKLDALCRSLGVTRVPVHEPGRALATYEEKGLQLATGEYGWGTEYVIALRTAASAHVARTRRREREREPLQVAREASTFDLSQPGEWLRFADAWRSGDLG